MAGQAQSRPEGSLGSSSQDKFTFFKECGFIEVGWPKDRKSLKANNQLIKKKAGVYVIISGDDLLYVGSSINLYSRVSGHHRAKEARKIGYKNIRILALITDNRLLIEPAIIFTQMPVFNIHYKRDKQNKYTGKPLYKLPAIP